MHFHTFLVLYICRTHVCFSPNERYLLATTLDGCVRLWDIAEAKVVKTYAAGHSRLGVSSCFAVTADGDQIIVTGSEDQAGPSCFDAQSRRIFQKLASCAADSSTACGGNGPELAVASSADLRCVASASTCGEYAIRLWRL
jgi:COMPASS component SWD3